MIVSSPSAVTSGSQVAFAERKGVCFDYATLYVSMCRAVGLKVRLVTGMGYRRRLLGGPRVEPGLVTRLKTDGSMWIRPSEARATRLSIRRILWTSTNMPTSRKNGKTARRLFN